MCGGNDSVIISTGGGCGFSGETIRISKNYSSCGFSDNGYTITKTVGSGCGSSTASYQIDDATGRSIIDAVNYRREAEAKIKRR